jgi:hypothetical protein
MKQYKQGLTTAMTHRAVNLGERPLERLEIMAKKISIRFADFVMQPGKRN